MAKKIILIVFGVVILLIGLAVTALGAAGLIFGGHTGVIQSGYHTVGTPTYAFVSDAREVRHGQGIEVRSGNATLRIDARNTGRPLFIGVGPAQQVQSYLSGVTYADVTDVNFSPFRLESHTVPGDARPAAPGDQSFWVAKSVGTSPRLSWAIASGSYRVVVMNADASSGPQADVRVGLSIPGLFGASLGTTIAGGLLSLIGIGLLAWGIAAKRRQPAVPPGYGPPGYGPPGGYPSGYPPQTGYGPQQGYPPQAYGPQPGYPPEPGYPGYAGSEQGGQAEPTAGAPPDATTAGTAPPDATTAGPPPDATTESTRAEPERSPYAPDRDDTRPSGTDDPANGGGSRGEG
ncbi:MAG TPA: hypothetical protein VKB59_12340 [Micromonosporaceae bacterium]|nr:hypothetical protein [Micromonosporaceae bacterium]